jgi:glycosyltransferase involved in cell wall biosynthesis
VACAVARPSAPLVVWFHSEVIRPQWKYRLFYRPFLDWALARAARIVVAAPPMRDVPALAAFRDKVVVIPYGLDPAPYALTEPSPRAAGDVRPPTLLFVGRLVAYKGVDVLLRAMVGVSASLVLVGDGPLRRTLEALAHELGVADRVQFAGRVADADRLEWYAHADAVVLPSVSRQEAFGMVQVEAMLSGRPVVSTSLPTGVPWVNRHGETGIVVPPGDVAALREALVRISSDEVMRRRLGRTARAHALEHFTAVRMCATFDALCRDVAEAHSAPVPQSLTARVG